MYLEWGATMPYLTRPRVGREIQMQWTTWGNDADYIVNEPLEIKVGGTHYRVPKFTSTDFASVPSPLRGLMGRVGPWTEASIVHDAAYRRSLKVKCVFRMMWIADSG